MSEPIQELPQLVKKRKVIKSGIYGHIPDHPVGTRFENREAMYSCGFHVTLQAGIQGRESLGACSVVLSGGYEDDVDLGYEFTYTGHGGQLPWQNKDRSQKKDQQWTRGNQALKMSCKLQRPVRVVRGFKLLSRWAPAEGYRYDGLYMVTEYGRKPGRSGFLVCLFRFERCEGQPPLPEPTGPRQEPRTLRHISPSSPSPPPTPRLPKRRRRTSEEAIETSSPKKSRILTMDPPMFVEGSSTSAISQSHILTRTNGGGSDYERLAFQTSPDYEEDFSEGSPSPYHTGKGKSVDRFPSTPSTEPEQAFRNLKVEDEDVHMSEDYVDTANDVPDNQSQNVNFNIKEEEVEEEEYEEQKEGEVEQHNDEEEEENNDDDSEEDGEIRVLQYAIRTKGVPVRRSYESDDEDSKLHALSYYTNPRATAQSDEDLSELEEGELVG